MKNDEIIGTHIFNV